MKFKIYTIIFAIFLILSLSTSIIAKEIPKTLKISENLGIDSINIVGEGIDYSLENEKLFIGFMDSESKIIIGENSYSDILESEFSGHPTYMELSSSGEILNADLTASKKTIFVFEEIPYEVPKGGRIIYQEGKISLLNNGEEEFKLNLSGNFLKLTPLPGILTNLIKDSKGNIFLEGELIINGNPLERLEKYSFPQVTISSKTGKVIKIGEGSSLIIGSFRHLAKEGDLNFYYDKEFIPQNHQGENYFNYADEKIRAGGSGFRSILNNEKIFPEFFQEFSDEDSLESERLPPKLEIALNGGEIELEKISQDKRPIALKTVFSGNIEIRNGEWQFFSKGKEFYSKNWDLQEFSAADMRMEFKQKDNSKRIFDLDINSGYYGPLSEEEKKRKNEEIKVLNSEIKKKEKSMDSFFEKKPDLEDHYLKKLKIEDEINQDMETLSFLNGQISRAERAGTKEQKEKLSKEYDLLQEEINKKILIRKKIINNIKYKSNLEKIIKIEYLIKLKEREIENLKEKIIRGDIQEGAFGEILQSEKGDSKVTYSGYIEAFPVIKNTDAKKYYSELYKPELRVNVGDKLLKNPVIEEKNIDILDLIVDSKYQTCADTAIEMRAKWEFEEVLRNKRENIQIELANGETLEFNKNSYSYWDSKLGKKVTKNILGNNPGKEFNKWITNVQKYTNTGSLQKSLKPIYDLSKLRPGDILTYHADPKSGYGHTIMIKEILEIPPGSGNLHYRVFMGYDPAMDARIEKDLFSSSELNEAFDNEILQSFSFD